MKHFGPLTPHRRTLTPRVLAVSRALLLAVMLLSIGAVTSAQTVASNATSLDEPSSAKAATGTYTDSLKQLSALYEQEVKRLAQENDKLKQLYADGIISRLDMEASDKQLADARARVDATQKQIAEANLRPALNPSGGPANVFTNQSWTTGNLTIDNLISYYGKQNGVDPYLVFCLMNQESGFTSRAISPKGAQGLMQLMPGTAARYGVTNPFDAAQSISAGTRYLKDLLQMFNGRVDLALAGYNAGEGAVIKYGYQIPPYSETRNYVRLITMRYGKTAVVSRKT